jgi:hypothetical protein
VAAEGWVDGYDLAANSHSRVFSLYVFSSTGPTLKKTNEIGPVKGKDKEKRTTS